MKSLDSRLGSPEFWIVIIMLVILAVLVVAVLIIPGPEAASAADLLDYRKSILAVIITAFGAWVGAGAAYYFGRENLREATRNMLAMRGLSPEELLRQTPVREVPPRIIDWVVKTSDTMDSVVNKLRSDMFRWFIPVVNDTDAKLATVIHEEAIWRFVADSQAAGTPAKVVGGKNVSDLLNFLEQQGSEELKKRFRDIFVSAKLEDDVAKVNEQMQKNDVKLAIIKDENDKPMYFITSGDVRRVLLRSDKE